MWEEEDTIKSKEKNWIGFSFFINQKLKREKMK